MTIILLIFLGSGIGGVTRYLVSTGCYQLLGQNFPYGTFIVNITGCLLMGILFALILDRLNGTGPQLRPLLLVGFLGGYTTFSSFSIETINLIENGKLMVASFNILFSVIGCLMGTWIGVLIGRQL